MVENSNAYRLVHAEGDLAPGLIVDRYGRLHLLQLLTRAWIGFLKEIVNVLEELLQPQGIVARK